MIYSWGVPVTRLRAGHKTDPYSEQSDELDWDSPDEVVFPSCVVWQESSLAVPPVDQRRAQVVTVTKVALPYDADVKPDDRFIVNGSTYDVQGEPARYHSPFTSWEPGCVVTGVLRDG